MSKILVTGGAGYIGSHTAVALIEAGYETVIADNLNNSRADAVDNIEKITGVRPAFYKVNTASRNETKKIFSDHPDIAAAIHFAGHKAVGESVKKPLMYYRNNLDSLMTVVECMMENGAANIVFSSSATVYGQPDILPATETSPIKKASSPYGSTKQICETILEDSCAAYPGMKTVLLRYFNPVGAHSSALIGELPSGVPNNLMPFITQTAAGIREKLRIFGNDYGTPDGTCIRDYIHVEDLASAHVSAMERLLGSNMETPCEVFNIGTGRGISVLEMVRAFERVTGVKLNHEFAPRREGDAESVWADTSKAEKILGWKAARTLDDMILSAWNWEKHLENL
jgi:UDP-glucose 4-epimerase